ncbi:50S ribosomal protein L5 [candidate division WOR-3 bacterium]|nr:50S ribosomal protein L5 [candidate division WOR-3 bacterium]
MVRIKNLYNETVLPAMMKSFGYKNVYEVPHLVKIVVNIGLGEAVDNSKLIDIVSSDIAIITGQKPLIIKAKRSVASFKLRKGKPIGLKVTLRGNRMYEFFDRLNNFAIPRIRDFRGIDPDAFDGSGNYNLGITEHTIFPEIKFDKVKFNFGMDINFVTTARTDEEAFELLKGLGMPFKSKQ